MTQWLSSIMGNVGTGYCRTRDIASFIQYVLLPFQNLPSTLATMQLGNELHGGNLSDYQQLPLKPHKALYTLKMGKISGVSFHT